MPLVGFEPTISAGEQPQSYALDCAAIETGLLVTVQNKTIIHFNNIIFISFFVLTPILSEGHAGEPGHFK